MVVFERLEDAAAHKTSCALGLRNQIDHLEKRLRETEADLRAAGVELESRSVTQRKDDRQGLSDAEGLMLFPLGQPSQPSSDKKNRKSPQHGLEFDSATDSNYSPETLKFNFDF